MDYRKPICRAMNFIAQNLDRDLSLEEIAGAAAFSPFHFHRIFKAAVGETVGGFTRRLRLETAANRLIAYPDRDITTIALDCGFSSSQNFAKAFKGLFRLTPTNFRKSKIGNRQSNTGNAFRVEPVYDPGMVLKHRWERTDHPTARVEVVPEYRVAYIRKLGNYDNPTHDAAFEELMQWAVPRGYNAKGKIFSVYWDNPEVTPEYKCRVDACITIPIHGRCVHLPPVGPLPDNQTCHRGIVRTIVSRPGRAGEPDTGVSTLPWACEDKYHGCRTPPPGPIPERPLTGCTAPGCG